MTFVHPTNSIFQSFVEFKEAVGKAVDVEQNADISDEELSDMFIRQLADDYRGEWDRRYWEYIIREGLKPFNLVESYQDYIESNGEYDVESQKEIFKEFCRNYG